MKRHYRGEELKSQVKRRGTTDGLPISHGILIIPYHHIPIELKGNYHISLYYIIIYQISLCIIIYHQISTKYHYVSLFILTYRINGYKIQLNSMAHASWRWNSQPRRRLLQAKRFTQPRGIEAGARGARAPGDPGPKGWTRIYDSYLGFKKSWCSKPIH